VATRSPAQPTTSPRPTGIRERALRAARWAQSSIVLPVIVAALAYVLIGFNEGKAAGKQYEWNPSVFIKAGALFKAPKLLPHNAYVFSSTGYDGQFFFYLAQDPLLHNKAARRDQLSSPHIDNVPYRYQRILLPALGWLTSWGNPNVLQWTLPLINVLAVLGAGFLLGRFLARRGRSPWWSLVFMLSLGVMLGVVDDLSDPLAAGLFVAGVVWWLEDRSLPAIVALTGCLLARELYIVPVAVICLSELVRRRRQAWPWVVPPLVWGAWQVYLRVRLAASPTHGAHEPSVVPLLGAARKLKLILNEDSWGTANWEVAFIGLLLIIWLVFFVRSIETLREAARERRVSRAELLPVVALAAFVFVPFLTVDLWHYIPSYSRYAAPAAGLIVLAYALRPSRMLIWLSVALLALSFTSPVIGIGPTNHGPAGPPSIGIGY
jgi:hypothetical protein